jgi:hypothetical protein
MKLDSKESIELTIHAAMLMKSLSQFIGVKDVFMAKLYLQDVVEKLHGLGEVIDKLDKKGGS